METDSSSEKLTFDWCEREIKYYKNRAAECLTLKFVEKPNQEFDRFKWYILVALAQNRTLEKQGCDYWDGAGESLFDSFCRITGAKVAFSSFSVRYFCQLRGRRDKFTSRTQGSDEDRKDLFEREGGKYFLGRRKSIGEGKFRYLKTEINNTNTEFIEFQSAVMRLLESPEIAWLFKKTKPLFAEVIIQDDDSEYNLTNLLKRAQRSILIAGQNLYFLVESRCSRIKGKADYLAELKDWLEIDKKNRDLNILLCDPISIVAVLYHSIVDSPDFIEDICSSIEELKKWKQQVAAFNVNIKLTEVIPSSVTVIDEGLDTNVTIITPLLFEPRARQKIRFLLKGEDPEGIRRNIYTMYYQRLRSGRDIEDVTDDEIEHCRNCWKEYEKWK